MLTPELFDKVCEILEAKPLAEFKPHVSTTAHALLKYALLVLSWQKTCDKVIPLPSCTTCADPLVQHVQMNVHPHQHSALNIDTKQATWDYWRCCNMLLFEVPSALTALVYNPIQ